MTLADEARALELAELARHFYLWLRDPPEKELRNQPELKALKGLTPEQFHMHAGVYRKLPKSFLPNVVQFWDDLEEARWLRGYNRGVEYVLLVDNPEEGVFSPRSKLIKTSVKDSGEYFEIHENEVYLPPGGALEQRDAIKVAFPVLDSRIPDVKTLSVVRYHTFAGFLDRADFVWDDLEEVTRVGIQSRYRSIFDYEAPREEYRKNLGDIIPPYAGVTAKEFHAYLYRYATYKERQRGDSGGQYYAKWLKDEPRDPKDRELRPTKLTGEYIKDNFHEWVLQKNESYLLVSLRERQVLYRLRLTPGNGRTRFELDVHDVLRLHGRNGTSFREPIQVKPPVRAVIFHALDGARELPAQIRARNRIELSTGGSERYSFDYKAAVRWFFADQTTKHVTSDEDEVWFDIFVDTFFSDLVYGIDGNLPNVQASTFSAEQLAEFADDPTGTIRQYLDQNVTSHGRGVNLRYVVKGWMYGESEVNRRQLIGISSSGFVYEWYVETSLVTRMPVGAWLNANDRDRIYANVYEGTKGVIPYAMAVSIGGVIVAASAVAGFAILGQVARTAIRKLVTDPAVQQFTKQAAKEALRQLRPQLVAVMTEGVMALVPKTSDVRVEFFRGFAHGFGAGAIEHWFEQFDERFEKAVTKLYKSAIGRATGGVYRVHQIYLKLSAAYHHMTAALRAIRKVWTDERARALARALSLLGQRFGLALLIILFLAVYVDTARADFDRTRRDHFVKQQRDLLRLMIRETAADIAVNAEQLRNDLQGPPPKSDVWRERNERIATKLARAIAGTPGQPSQLPQIAVDVLKELLAELGVKNWDELEKLGVLDVLALGIDATLDRHPTLAADAARTLGEASGELVGTIFLERALLSSTLRKRFASSRPLDQAFQRTMAGGSARALHAFVRNSLDGLRQVARRAAKVTDPVTTGTSASPIAFERASRSGRSYGEILETLLSTDREVGESMARLAANPTLADSVRAVHQRAQGELPPGVDSWTADPAAWPPDAMQFLVESWMRTGVHLLLTAFNEIEDAAPYGGEFRLAQLLAWVGLDVSLDDKTVQALRVKFERPGSGLAASFRRAVGTQGGSDGSP